MTVEFCSFVGTFPVNNTSPSIHRYEREREGRQNSNDSQERQQHESAQPIHLYISNDMV
jgi:hypothetical protein